MPTHTPQPEAAKRSTKQPDPPLTRKLALLANITPCAERIIPGPLSTQGWGEGNTLEILVDIIYSSTGRYVAIRARERSHYSKFPAYKEAARQALHCQGTRQSAPNTCAHYRGVDLETTQPSPHTPPAGDIGRPESDGNRGGRGGSLRIGHAIPVAQSGHRRARNGPDRVPMRVASIFCDALYSEKAYQGKATGTRSEATDILSAGLWAWARTNLKVSFFAPCGERS